MLKSDLILFQILKLHHNFLSSLNNFVIVGVISFALVIPALEPAAGMAEAQQFSPPVSIIEAGLQQEQQEGLQQDSESSTQLSQGMIADLAKPAVVQVGSLFAAQVFAYDWIVNENLMQQHLAGLVNQGYLNPYDAQSVASARTQLFLQNPAAYIIPMNSIVQTESQARFTGSGFIITHDGYIVTNAHVVSPPQNQIEFALLQTALNNFIASDLQEFGFALTQQQYNALSNVLAQYYSTNMRIESLESVAYVLARYSIPGPVVQVGEQAILAEVIPHATGAPIPGKDVAVVKVEGRNLPTVPLGDDTDLQSLDDVIVIGFPAAVSSNIVLSPTGQEPSIITGQFGGYQRTIGDWSAMHVQAPFTHGNSGGPALDSSGRVVGVATFGSIDPTTGQEISAFNFLVPVSIVKDFLNRASIQPTESQFTTMFRHALTEYSAGDYQESLNILQRIDDMLPNNPYVINYISKAQLEASSGATNNIQNLDE